MQDPSKNLFWYPISMLNLLYRRWSSLASLLILLWISNIILKRWQRSSPLLCFSCEMQKIFSTWRHCGPCITQSFIPSLFMASTYGPAQRILIYMVSSSNKKLLCGLYVDSDMWITRNLSLNSKKSCRLSTSWTSFFTSSSCSTISKVSYHLYSTAPGHLHH